MDDSYEIDDSCIPKVGMMFESLDDVFEFWKSYGGKVGFGVRKEYNNKNKNGTIIGKLFVCYKEGFKKKGDVRTDEFHRRADVKCGCECKLKVVLDSESGKYVVSKFVEDHNHDLQPRETAHMLNSQREITMTQALAIELACDSGLTPRETQELMSREAGGRAKLGFVIEDQKTYLRSRRKRDMARGELGSVLSYFQKRNKSDARFSYALQLDNDELVTNIFWVDAKMVADYDAFGDVVTFDTTFGTNKELRPLGVFTGLNNHRQMVVFGAALLYDETAESFQWLFETFVNSHDGKRPRTIFTDQDAAMKVALDTIWPDVYHGLCVWHLQQNGIKHLSGYMKNKSPFWSQFQRCMFDYEDKEEFELEWHKLINAYHLKDNAWLNRMYGLKEKWAHSYMKETFTLGIRSTQLSESLNGDLKDHLKSDMNIGDFFKHFDRVVDQKRANELVAVFEMIQKVPSLGFSQSPILIQASQRYTLIFFDIFKTEYGLAESVIIKNESNAPEFVVALHRNPKKEYKVMCDPTNEVASCSCMHFEHIGILCCHVLGVFSRLRIMEIPEKFILNRLTRITRGRFLPLDGRPNEEEKEEDAKGWVRRIQTQLLRLTIRASIHMEMRAKVEEKIEEIMMVLDSFTSGVAIQNDVVEEVVPSLMNSARGLKKKDGRRGKRRLKPLHETRKKKFTNQRNSNLRIESSKRLVEKTQNEGLDLNLEPTGEDFNLTLTTSSNIVEPEVYSRFGYPSGTTNFDLGADSQGWLNFLHFHPSPDKNARC